MARYALVVGISEYKHLPSPLSKTLGDAEAVANLLRSHGDFQEVTLLNTPKLIKADLFAQLNRLLIEQATSSEVLIYYTGHGVLVEDCGVKQGYLAPSDCKATKESVTDGIPFVGLNNLIARSPLSSLVMFLDCCHSGALLQAIAESFTAFNKTDKDYLLISACREFEQAAAMKKEAHSIFTGALLEALSESRQNDEGKINSGSLFGFISDRLKQKQQEPRQLGYGRAMEIVNYRQVVSQKVIDETCPYVGLNAFDESTAQWFFGRETAFKRLMSKIEQSPFVFVVGVSGSGKSSLVKAKLIPEMKRRGHRILLMKPWSNPIQKLKDVFEEILEETGTDVIEFEQRIDTDGLLVAIADLPKPILLVIDQFEEVFTVCSQVAERRKFIQMLVDVAQTQTADFWADFVVVATMRIDFLADCTYANLDAIVNEQMVVISGMSEDELRDAIAKPAETQCYQLSDGLLDAILQDIEAEPNCLPLLEFALQELWENRNRQHRRLSLEGYRQMERLKGALNRHADRLYEQQSASGREWMRRIFLKLVRTGKDAKDTRQREQRQVILDLAGEDGNVRKEIERILKSLEGKNGRLLVASEENGVAIVDLAHEALMDGWKRFAEWRLEDRDLRRLCDRVKDAFEEWIGKEKNEDYFLPNGLRLEVREQWESIKPLLSIEEQDYFHSSESYMLLREQLGGANKRLAVVVQELKNLAVLDYLTQLANRRFFDEYLEQEWQRLAAEKSPFSLIMCEIDCFKDYVDIYGHMVGDDCIRKVSRIIGESVNQPKDLAANYRGEVFALVLPNTTKEDALQKAESIKSQVVALEIPHKNSIFGKFVTLSVGVTSLVPLVTSSSLEILKSVDYELSLAKKLGKR